MRCFTVYKHLTNPGYQFLIPNHPNACSVREASWMFFQIQILVVAMDTMFTRSRVRVLKSRE